MIFVTVGTHEQGFERLIKKVDDLVRDGKIKEDVIMQIGFTQYKPKYCKWYTIIPYVDMHKYIDDARIIITHGGPASFIMPLQIGKVPIVVPRQEKYHEHINNHQVEFTKHISSRLGNIIPVYEIEDLINTIENYDNLVSNVDKKMAMHNKEFINGFDKIVKGLFD